MTTEDLATLSDLLHRFVAQHVNTPHTTTAVHVVLQHIRRVRGRRGKGTGPRA